MPTTTAKPKVPQTVRLKPAVQRELARLAKYHGDAPAPHAEKILEAYTQGLAFCRGCGYPHPLDEFHRGKP